MIRVIQCLDQHIWININPANRPQPGFLLIGIAVILLVSCQQKTVVTVPENSRKITQEKSFSSKTLPEKSKKVQLPADAPEIISDFGSLLGVGGRKRKMPHQGVDIQDKPGTPILAARDGTILEVHDEKCWGLTIVIDHGPDPGGEKLYALYGHLGAHSVEQGTKVKRGQKIGEMGDDLKRNCTGGVGHLHFQLGRRYRTSKQRWWGSAYFLEDYKDAPNPHLYWADGPFQVTCFEPLKTYPHHSLTYPVQCRFFEDVPSS